MNDRFDHHPDDDEIVGFLRGADPGDPPVTLGPGSSLRHRAAVRHARRQAIGAVLAVGLIGVAVLGSVVGTRHHANVAADHSNIASPSITTRADRSAIPSKTVAVAPPTGEPTEIVSAPTPTVAATETAKSNTQSASPVVPTITSLSIRNPGPLTVGQTIFYTVRYVAQGSVVPSIVSTDFGDGSTGESIGMCADPGDQGTAPTGASSVAGELSTPSHAYASPGTYTVRVTVELACVKGVVPRTVSATFGVTGTVPSTSPSPSVPASESPSPSSSPSAPAPGSATPTP